MKSMTKYSKHKTIFLLLLCRATQKKFIIEVKPKAQCKEPVKTPKRKTRRWYKEVQTWGINQAKWKSAIDYCENRGMEFKILTEDHLNPKYK